MADPHVEHHLLHVAATLRRDTPHDLPPHAAARRRQLLIELERYARAGRFPRPDGPVSPRRRRIEPRRAFAAPGARAPIFEDRAGRRCAVGHLLGLERPDLVSAVRDSANGVFLPELASPELDAWAARSGLTRAELAWIQPSYCWEVPECTDEFEVATPAPIAQQCDGPDARLVGTSSGQAISCQACDGPLQVWVAVQNAGTEPAFDVVVSLGAGSDVLDAAVLPQLTPGEVVQVGPLLAPDVAAVNHQGWVAADAPDGCASPSQALPWGYAGSYYPPGFVEPAACGGGCPGYGYGETGDTGGSGAPTGSAGDSGAPTTQPGGSGGGDTAADTAAADTAAAPSPDKACGCGSSGGPGPAVGLVLLAGWRRRSVSPPGTRATRS